MPQLVYSFQNTKRNGAAFAQTVGFAYVWKMRFGALFLKYVPKEKIMSFPFAFKIEELQSGIVFVQLFEHMEDPYTPDNVFKQWKWKVWIGFDELEKKYGL